MFSPWKAVLSPLCLKERRRHPLHQLCPLSVSASRARRCERGGSRSAQAIKTLFIAVMTYSLFSFPAGCSRSYSIWKSLRTAWPHAKREPCERKLNKEFRGHGYTSLDFRQPVLSGDLTDGRAARRCGAEFPALPPRGAGLPCSIPGGPCPPNSGKDTASGFGWERSPGSDAGMGEKKNK